MRGTCNKCGAPAFLSRGKSEPCACGGTVTAKTAESREVVRAAGTSDGASKGWEHRAKTYDAAHNASDLATRHSLIANGAGSAMNADALHKTAAEAHEHAAKTRRDLAAETHGSDKHHHLNMADEHSQRANQHYRQMAKYRGSDAADTDTILASGNSEGAKKGWEGKRSHAYALSNTANERSDFNGGKAESHWSAANAHLHAKEAHGNLANDLNDEGMKTSAGVHEHLRDFHEKKWKEHVKEAGGSTWDDRAKASSATSTEVIHCRSHSASGPVLATDKPWSPGEQVSFMWMPAGTSTICAGFRKSSIELTVNCDENTAAAVQASLESWREERPKQEPFGCIEHKEQEASFRVGASCGFKWNDDGVYLAAEPTTLGAQNVNGRVHRSWSPSFTTDADYSKATERNEVLMFPEGVRGSRSNPAEITGVDFCVGTLTNKPAFHSMSPVKASEGEDAVQATWSDAARKAAAEARKKHNLSDEDGWNTFGPGTGAYDQNAHSFQKEVPGGHLRGDTVQYNINPTARRKGFSLSSAGHPDSGGLWKDHGTFNTHRQAMKAAHEHYHTTISEKTTASDAASTESIKANCANTLKQDVPDATPAEVACYEKCLHEGGSHTRAVEEIRKQRNPAAKASEPITADAILAQQSVALDKVNAMATEMGVAKTKLDEVYDVVMAGGTSEGVRKSWETRKHSGVGDSGQIHRALTGLGYKSKGTELFSSGTSESRYEHPDGHNAFVQRKSNERKSSVLTESKHEDHADDVKMALDNIRSGKHHFATASDQNPEDILESIYARAGESL